MNINVQLCGLVIIIFISLLSMSHKRLGTVSEKSFFLLVVISFISVCLDILSIVFINFQDKIPELLVHAVCKSYLMSMVWVGWIYFCYVMLDLNSDSKQHFRTKLIMAIVSIVESITIALLPIKTFLNGNECYTYDLAVTFTYVFASLYILFAITVSIFVLAKKNSRRGMAMLMTCVIWIVSAIIQFFNNQILLVGFAMSAGVMIIFAVLDNPDANLDKEFGCFNPYALSTYLNTKFFRNEKFSILDFSVVGVKALEDQDIDVKEAALRMVNYLDSNKKVKIFKNINTGLIFIADNLDDLESVSDGICKFLSKYENVAQYIVMFTVGDAHELGSVDNLTRFLTFARTRNEKLPSLITHTSQNTIEKYKEAQKVEDEIKLALNEDRVEIFLQPIVDTGSVKPTAAEALVRIRNVDGTYLSPGKFIPVAEATGLVKDIGERVLNKVCKIINETDIISLGIEKIHVNLSAVQCDDPKTASKLIEIVEKNGVNSKYISLEITESAVASNRETLLENMNTLVKKGFSFSLDDFGKGESNLMYIVDLPVDELKIDMDLSKAFFSNSKAKIVVKAICNMANMLNVPIVAEGIENDFEYKAMNNEGITHIQGYFFSKPLPVDEFLDFVKSNKNLKKTMNIKPEKKREEDSFDKIKLTGNNILLIEDNELNAVIEKELLEYAGYKVDTVNDGVYAIELLSKQEKKVYDLILTDIQMPIMDGFETTRRIRFLPNKQIANTPIVAMSSMNFTELKKRALKVGMSNQLRKPFDIKEFKQIVEKESKK
mgnify:CR=1 FL=1